MFTTHMLNTEGKKQMAAFKTAAKNFVVEAIQSMEDSKEKDIFLQKIDEAVFFGAKAIAQMEDNHESKTDY
jgi:uncharacterized protein YaaR (DUF327 family)